MLKRFFSFRRTSLEEAKRIIAASYFGLLRRPPEQEVIDKTAKAMSVGQLACADFLEGILHSEEYLSNTDNVEQYDLSRLHQDLVFINKDFGKVERIIYFCFGNPKPIGGVKVIFRHAQIINNCKKYKIKSEIFFPEHLDFTPRWFNHSCPIKRDSIFNRKTDFIIIPEMWALTYGLRLKQAGIRYGIFVQNGYLIFHEINSANSNQLNDLCEVYSRADLVLSISDNVDSCLNTIFDSIESKIYRVGLSVDTEIFYPIMHKKNQICYMPRKLPHHSRWLINLLSLRLDKNWEIVAIEGQSEQEVAKILSSSKIFLSFSDQEGFALPPLEAALCGNKVIGYTGEAAKEYFRGDLFCEINSGDLLSFYEAVMKEVTSISIDNDKFSSENEIVSNINFLKEKYSVKREADLLESLVDRILNS